MLQPFDFCRWGLGARNAAQLVAARDLGEAGTGRLCGGARVKAEIQCVYPKHMKQIHQ